MVHHLPVKVRIPTAHRCLSIQRLRMVSHAAYKLFDGCCMLAEQLCSLSFNWTLDESNEALFEELRAVGLIELDRPAFLSNSQTFDGLLPACEAVDPAQKKSVGGKPTDQQNKKSYTA